MVRIPKLTPNGPIARIEDVLDDLLPIGPQPPPPGNGDDEPPQNGGGPPSGPPDPRWQQVDLFRIDEQSDEHHVEAWVEDFEKRTTTSHLPGDNIAYRFRGRIHNRGGRGTIQTEFEVEGTQHKVRYAPDGDAKKQPRITLDHGESTFFETIGRFPNDGEDAPVILKVFDVETRDNADILNGKVIEDAARTQAHNRTGPPSGLNETLEAGEFGPISEHRPLR